METPRATTPGETPRVLHLSWDFVRPSQGWIYDVVKLPGRYTADVVCERRILADEFPFARVDARLPRSRRGSPEWWTRQLNKRTPLQIPPYNYWRSALRTCAPADVVHAHFGPVGWLAVNSGLAPVVTSFYGYDATEALTLSYWGQRYPELFRRGGLFVVEGPSMGRRLEAIGAPAERIRVLPLLADVDLVHWRPPATSGNLRVLMAGRLVQKKGFTLGVQAFAKVLAGTSAQLVIIGDGPEAPKLRNAVDLAGITAQVDFIPFLSRADFRAKLASCDVLLQPSLTADSGDSEGGAPVVLLDAQATGVVVVASRHDDIPFVLDPASAYLCPEADLDGLVGALSSAVASRDEWPDRAWAARRHVEAQHGAASVARRRDGIYAEATTLWT